MGATRPASVHPVNSPAPLALRIGFWICTLIAVGVVIRRLYALAKPSSSGPPEMAGLDAAFANHTVLTLAHIVPALFFVLLAPFVVFRRTPKYAWAEQSLFPLGAVVGITAYAMSIYAVGGWVERSAVLLFDTLFLYSLFRAFQARFHPAESRRWLLRSIIVLLGIATTRPVMGILFATSRITHLTPQQFFGLAFWIGFSLNLVIGEIFLRRRKIIS